MTRIIDPRTGEPFNFIAKEEPQTSKLGSMGSDIAGHPSRGLTPGKIASILDAAERGDIIKQCDLFEDMEEKDGHIFTEMSKRKRQLLTLPWEIMPPDDASAQEQEWADEVSELIKALPDIEDIIFDMADAIGKGFSCLEFEWEVIENKQLPTTIEFIKQRKFIVKGNDIRLRDNSNEGEALRPFSWITHIHKARSGYLDRSGLLRTLVWPYLFKNYSVRDLAEFLEIYGLPLRLGTYPRGANDKEKSTLLRAVAGIGHDAAGIVPEGMMIEFKEAAKGNKDPFEYMIEWCERTESKVIVGQTLTTQADGKTSTNALGNVHMEVMRDLTVSDARQIQSTLTRDLVYPIAAVNIPNLDPTRAPRFEFDLHECEDIKTFSEALYKLMDTGMDIPEDWAREKMGIPEAKEGDRLLKKPTTQQTTALRFDHTSSCKNHRHEQDEIDRLTNQLENETSASIDKLIEPIVKLVNNAESLDEIREGIINFYPDYDTSQLGSVMQQALMIAEMGGRFEVSEGE